MHMRTRRKHTLAVSVGGLTDFLTCTCSEHTLAVSEVKRCGERVKGSYVVNTLTFFCFVRAILSVCDSNSNTKMRYDPGSKNAITFVCMCGNNSCSFSYTAQEQSVTDGPHTVQLQYQKQRRLGGAEYITGVILKVPASLVFVVRDSFTSCKEGQ